MIQTLKRLFTEPEGDGEHDIEEQRRLAAAALLIEVARADFTQDANEERAMANLLCNSLQLGRDDVEVLLRDATERVDTATSLYEFTRLVNDHYSPVQKAELIDIMWRVAFADSELDKYEEHLIRKVAELIYVPHDEFIRSKIAARQDAGVEE
jgi:uncharacterized tellurite resistance protein B-like protein